MSTVGRKSSQRLGGRHYEYVYVQLRGIMSQGTGRRQTESSATYITS